MTTLQDTENFIVDIEPQQTDAALQWYRAQGATDVGPLANISKVIGSNLWVLAMPPGTLEQQMWVLGVREVLGEVEHGFYS